MSTGAAPMTQICDDMRAEHEDLDSLVAPLTEATWDAPTPAEGWTIRDQISHLAYFDRVALVSAMDPNRFRVEREIALADVAALIADSVDLGRALPAAQLLGYWRNWRQELVAALRELDHSDRIPWYGPEMSAASFASARLMETWAHGQDVADALGIFRVPSARLRHVAHLGVRAFANSFRAHNLAVPDCSVLVELDGPGGARWTWGDASVLGDSVRGPALDFCLVVTQRRHRADTDLQMVGPVAEAWMEVAQAFAGPPGAGRRPGQFGRGAQGTREQR